MVFDGDATVWSVDESRQEERRLRHGLHTASGHHVTVTGSDRERRQHHRFHPRGANLVDGGSLGDVIASGPQSHLPRGTLADASLQHIAEEDFFNRIFREGNTGKSGFKQVK